MIYYLPLEPYEERYTCQLADWTINRFKERKVNFYVVNGKQLPTAKYIRKSVALDPHGRSYYALMQTAELVKLLDSGKITSEDVIYNQDYFHPGWSAIPYILDQVNENPRTYTHLLAQSVDPNDFTFPMRYWMRHYEMMVDQMITGIFVASSCMVEMLRAALFKSPIHVVGLPFDKKEVRSRIRNLLPLKERSKRVIFASRWDREKQPWFYMDLIERAQDFNDLKDYEFCVCTGSPVLRSNEPQLVERALQLRTKGLLTIYSGLKKTQYYKIMADSRLHFNCALQDFVSNTLNEASALGTPSLLPAYLSFPEAVENNKEHLYVPWSLEDAFIKMIKILNHPPYASISYSATKQHKTLDRVIDIMVNNESLERD